MKTLRRARARATRGEYRTSGLYGGSLSGVPRTAYLVSRMKADVVAQALATIDEIRALLQAPQFAVRRFEQLASQGPLDRLSDQIDSVKVAADRVRAQLLRR